MGIAGAGSGIDLRRLSSAHAIGNDFAEARSNGPSAVLVAVAFPKSTENRAASAPSPGKGNALRGANGGF
jgi:hypothetical protein